MIVFLDTSVLGQVANPEGNDDIRECKKWFETIIVRGAFLVTSEICYYEVARGLKNALLSSDHRVSGLIKLEELREIVTFLPVDQKVVKVSSEVWALARFKGILMTNPARLDADAIICGHWKILQEENPGRSVIVATENLRDLGRFSTADHWENIKL